MIGRIPFFIGAFSLFLAFYHGAKVAGYRGSGTFALTGDPYRQGFQWWLAPPLEAIAAAMQDAFLENA